MAADNKRFTDHAHSPQGLSPIFGVFDAPPMPVEAAVAAAAPALLPILDALLYTSKQNLKQAGVKAALARDAARGMTPDHARALYLYTADSPLYQELNGTLREQDRTKLRPCFGYLRLLLDALDALPKAPGPRVLNRGVPLGLVAMYPDEHVVGEGMVWWGFSSTTSRADVLKDPTFLGTDGARTLFQITTRGGACVTEYSAIPKESEVSSPVLNCPFNCRAFQFN